MSRRILGWLTIAILTVAWCGDASCDALLEDNLALPPSSDVCREDLASLRRTISERGKLIGAARARPASPDEACGLLNKLANSEMRLINYVRANAEKCGIPPDFISRLRSGRRTTESMVQNACQAAREAASRGPVGPVGDFDHLLYRRGDFDLPK